MPRPLILLVILMTLSGAQISQAAPDGTGGSGSSGAAFLRQHYSGPQTPGESNHFIDLWAEQNLRALAFECHLTNNHALFVNSHGMGVLTRSGTQQAYYPHQSLLGSSAKAPRFLAADLAKIVGASQAERIHNILLSSCNADGSFSAAELRKYFFNATNIVHMPAGKLGYQSMFFQVLTTDSSRVQPLYEICAKNKSGKLEFFLEKSPSPHGTQLTPYIAELFRPGATAPFKRQVAGREILVCLQPSFFIPQAAGLPNTAAPLTPSAQSGQSTAFPHPSARP